MPTGFVPALPAIAAALAVVMVIRPERALLRGGRIMVNHPLSFVVFLGFCFSLWLRASVVKPLSFLALKSLHVPVQRL
jgi:hypothetical protein